MNTSRLLIAAAVLVFAGAAAQAADKSEKLAKNEAKLAEMLKGRTAGEPVSCIPEFHSSRVQVIEGVALVYGVGKTLYVAKPDHPESMQWDDIMVVKRFGGQLCNTDIIRTVDRMSGFTTGVVFMGKFVPYRKPD
ncbi:MAG TPA: hypothetical protein VKO83_11310 [Steroidobacteraceae bacterium]|nr:hypothetical protein [Steroidobacteraceae bacterium]